MNKEGVELRYDGKGDRITLVVCLQAGQIAHEKVGVNQMVMVSCVHIVSITHIGFIPRSNTQ